MNVYLWFKKVPALLLKENKFLMQIYPITHTLNTSTKDTYPLPPTNMEFWCYQHSKLHDFTYQLLCPASLCYRLIRQLSGGKISQRHVLAQNPVNSLGACANQCALFPGCAAISVQKSVVDGNGGGLCLLGDASYDTTADGAFYLYRFAWWHFCGTLVCSRGFSL